jgi:hypothetical protein
MKEAEANSATTATGLLDVPPIPQTRAEAKRIRGELDTLLTQQLGKYASEDTRKALGDLRAKDSRTDPTFKQVRKISERFEEALDAMFFENALLGPLTRKYGVF